jgi:hypothetical protein
VSRAVDALRAAENPQKAAFLGTLRAVPCSVPDVCAVQSLCLAAYEGHVRALELIEQVKASASSAPVEKLKADLTAADASLSAAKVATEECTSKQGALIRQFRVGR